MSFRLAPFNRHSHQPAFWIIYILAVLFSLQTLIVAYSNSTYIEQFVSPSVVGLLYSFSASISVLIFLYITHVLRRVGNVQLTLMIGVVYLLALITLATSTIPSLSVIAFVTFLVINPLLFLSMDIFSETLIGTNESITGSRKGLTLTLMSVAAVVAPLLMALIVGDNQENLYRTYLVSASVFLLFLLLVKFLFTDFIDPPYREQRLRGVATQFWRDKNLRNVIFSHLFLQLFFSWMVIYVPLYLASVLHFSWEAIGSIMAVALISYVIFEYPVGYLADHYYGEKEMMAIGFLIIILSMSSIAFMGSAGVVWWMVLMFVSRAGASMVEATTESYFFKHTDGSNPQMLSLFRLTRPLATVFGALLGSILLLFIPFSLAFVVLATCLLPALYTTSRIEDTL